MKKFAIILSLLLATAIVSRAQQSPSSTEITGTVVDQVGVAIPDTRVVFSAGSSKFEAISNDKGVYTIRVPEGTYIVEAQYTKHKGWLKWKIEGYEIPSGSKMTLDICLRVAPVTDYT